MKNLRLILSLFILIGLYSCEDPLDFDTLEATDFPPGILSVTPQGKQLVGDFNIRAVFADGSVSPLSSATVTLLNGGSEVFSKTESLSGTMDSIVIEGSEFNASAFEVGQNLTIEIAVTDSKNQTTNRTVDFEVSLLPFAANHDEMYLAGSFNGWGSTAMTLVSDNTWVVQEVDLQGGGWKIKNTEDFSDEDWGDPNCTGQMFSNISSPGENGDTGEGCVPAGLVNIRFNDQTLIYTAEPAVTFEGNASGLFLLGTFNNFQGDEFEFTQTADNTWELRDVQIENGTEFRFAESPDFMGTNWGDSGEEGRAEAFGPNIMFTEQTAFYNITFNDQTLRYNFEFLRFPSIGIIGDATPGGWDTDTDLTDNGDGTFSLLVELTDGEAKFRANDDWATNWGGTDFPSGVATLDGPNIPVTAGLYNVTFNPETAAYDFAPGLESLGIIGNATPGGWDADTDMRDNGDGTYQIVLGLTDGEVKFRTNDDWATNWGDNDGDNVGDLEGNNIIVSAGIYLITFNPSTAAYSIEPTTVGIIGDATPSGWDSDTDMTASDQNTSPGELTLTLELVDGEAKFRANNDWPWNWGASDFPMGTGTIDGPNIPVPAGTYTVTFNVNTGAYSFE